MGSLTAAHVCGVRQSAVLEAAGAVVDSEEDDVDEPDDESEGAAVADDFAADPPESVL